MSDPDDLPFIIKGEPRQPAEAPPDQPPQSTEAWRELAERRAAAQHPRGWPAFMKGRLRSEAIRREMQLLIHHYSPERELWQGRGLLPGYDDGHLVESHEQLDIREARKVRTWAAERDRQHDERHLFADDPYCPACCGKEVAIRRLTRAYIEDSRRPPQDTWDGQFELSNRCSSYLTLSQLRKIKPATMLFDEVLPQGAFGYITGRDATWKTFLVITLALHALVARSWHGRAYHGEQSGSRVVIIASEGVGNLPGRIDACKIHHGIDLDEEDDENLRVRPAPVNLFAGGADYHELLRFVREFKPALIFIDTLNRSAGGADQNSASDMSIVTANAARVKAAAGESCTVVIIAHTDKGDHDARGSSSIEDDADFVLHCKKTDTDRMQLKVAKMKDGPSGQSIELRAVPVADSLVLTTATGMPEGISSLDLRSRIVGALFAVRGQDEPTQAQVLAMVKDDGSGRPASRTEVYRVLGELERDGAVIKTKHGTGATAPYRYRLAPSQYPPDVREG